MKRVLITGASGFLGKKLCSMLRANGLYVKALVRNAKNLLDSIDCDELIEGALPNNLPSDMLLNIDTVIHLAGIAHANNDSSIKSADYFNVNAKGTDNLLSLALENGVKRFIFISTIKAVKDDPNNCIDESYLAMPFDPYGLSKRKAEEIVINYKDKMHVCVLRPALVYGEGVKGNLLSMIKGIKGGYFPPLPNIQNCRSLISANDLFQAIMLAVQNPKANGKTYFVTDNRDYSTSELYQALHFEIKGRINKFFIPLFLLKFMAVVGDLICYVTKLNMPINSDKLNKLICSSRFSSKLIMNELGYKPNFNFFDLVSCMVK